MADRRVRLHPAAVAKLEELQREMIVEGYKTRYTADIVNALILAATPQSTVGSCMSYVRRRALGLLDG